jgi:hypothetical protein
VLVADAGCHNVHKAMTDIPFSFGTPLHTRLINNLVPTLSIVQEFLTHQQRASLREIDQICQEIVIDLHTETFVATWTIVTVTGEKPIPENARW